MMTRNEWQLFAEQEKILCADGLDDAIIGYTYAMLKGGLFLKAVYSIEKIIDILMNRDGMSYDEAVEFFEFNIESAYVGPQTPIYINMIKDSDK